MIQFGRRRSAWLVTVLPLLAACLGDPSGPAGIVVVRSIVGGGDSLLVGAPAQPLASPIKFVATDEDGHAISGATIKWTITGRNASLSDSTVRTDQDGSFSAIWVLGTSAADTQALQATVSTGHRQGSVTLHAIARPITIAKLVTDPDTLLIKLGTPSSVKVFAVDPYGNVFNPPSVTFSVFNPLTATVDPAGLVHPVHRGYTQLFTLAGGVLDTVVVHVTQVVQRITVARDSLFFSALGEVQFDSVGLIDDLGLPVLDSIPVAIVQDSTVARLSGSSMLTVQGTGVGASIIRLAVGNVTHSVLARVAQLPTSVQLATHSITFDALTDTTRVTARVADSLNNTIPSATVTFVVHDSTIAGVDARGLVTSRANGSTLVTAIAGAAADTLTVSASQVVASVSVNRDTMSLHALSEQSQAQAIAKDRLGVPVSGAVLTFRSLDTTIATVSSAGVVRATNNGQTIVVAKAATDSTMVFVQVAQVAARVLLPADTMRFVALKETQVVTGIAVDSLGFAIRAGVSGLKIGDTTVVTRVDSQTIRATQNGATTVQFTVAGLPASTVVSVAQAPESLTAAITFGQPILTLRVGDSVPVACQVFDRGGSVVVGAQVLVSGKNATLSGSTCQKLAIARSGFDTLVFASGIAHQVLPIVVAAAPSISPTPYGQYINVDSFPTGFQPPWTISARRSTNGQIELYTALYADSADSSGEARADSHRFVSNDGINFQYAGVVLHHDNNHLGLNGSGIEQVAVVPRSDSAGWRMYYASGSFQCYGWQVFSATSADEVHWNKESGIRLSNFGNVPPQTCRTPPWPTGEGMVVDQLPNGQWRMIAATYVHVLPRQDAWQITQWTSPDQLNWTYVGPVLTSSQMPPEGSSDVYSPAIREFAPGLYRMVFTADDRGIVGARRRIWSAVSVDKVNWQVEGMLIGASDALSTSAFVYSAMVDDKVYFIRQADGDIRRFAVATVSMP